MRRVSSIVALLVMLLTALPALACSAAAPGLSRPEQDCCRQMHGKCGEMAKHGCCQVEARSDLNQLPANHVTASVLPRRITATFYPLPADTPAVVGNRWQLPEEHSPPGLLIAATTVLQI